MARKNKPTDVFRHVDMTAGPDACWPWQLAPGGVSRAMRDGERSSASKARPYFTVGGRKVLATRLIYQLVTGNELTSDQVIRHTCDNSMCCNPNHFEVGTHQENMLDMVARDRHGLPSHVVRRVRVLLERGGKTHQEIADLYGIGRSVVTRIANNQAHTHANDYPTDDDRQQPLT